MIRMAYMVWVAALTTVLAARPASACSVDRIPSATEVAEGATVILRVKAERYMPAKDRRYGIGRVLFRVVDTIKGDWRSPFFVSTAKSIDTLVGTKDQSHTIRFDPEAERVAASPTTTASARSTSSCFTRAICSGRLWHRSMKRSAVRMIRGWRGFVGERDEFVLSWLQHPR
jgi:hypothetical protein